MASRGSSHRTADGKEVRAPTVSEATGQSASASTEFEGPTDFACHGLRPWCRRGRVNCIYRLETNPAVVAWNSVERADCCWASSGPDGIWQLQQPLVLRVTTHGAQPRPAKPLSLQRYTACKNERDVSARRELSFGAACHCELSSGLLLFPVSER